MYDCNCSIIILLIRIVKKIGQVKKCSDKKSPMKKLKKIIFCIVLKRFWTIRSQINYKNNTKNKSQNLVIISPKNEPREKEF